MKNEKLLFIVNNPAFFLSHRLSLALLAKEKGYEIHVATTYSENFEKIQNYGFKTHKIFLKRGSTNVFYDFMTFCNIFKLIKSQKPDILHLLTAKCNIYGGIASRFISIPKVIHAITGLGHIFVDRDQNIYKKILKKLVINLYRISIKSTSMVIFQNKENLDFFLKKRIISENQANLILGSGVETDTFVFKLEDFSDNPIVLFPSRLLIEKGVLTFIEASKLIKNKRNVRMLIAGDIDYENPSSISKDQLKSAVDLGLIEWNGHVEDMPSLLAKSSIICLPSYYPEGIPKSLIEAASCGRPIITTDMPGCNEIVRNNYNGKLIPVDSPESLANEIINLIDSKELRQKYGANGRKLVLEKFSSDIINNATIELYLN